MRIISLFIIVTVIICGCNSNPEKKTISVANDCAFLKELIEPNDSAIEININEFDSLCGKSRYDLIYNKIIYKNLTIIPYKLKIFDSIYKVFAKNPRVITCGLQNYIKILYSNKDSILLFGNNFKICNINFVDSILFQMQKNETRNTQIFIQCYSASKIEIQQLLTKVKICIEKLYKYYALNRFKKNICDLNNLQKDTFSNEFNIQVMLPYSIDPLSPPLPIRTKNVRHSRHH